MTYENAKIEPSLDEIFNDPIFQLLMQKDGVEGESLYPELMKVAEQRKLDTVAA